MKDYYRILEVSPSASFEVIKASYRALAKKYHPDTQTSSNTGKTMADINEAYETLSNPQSRKEYDQQYSRFIKQHKIRVKKRFQEMTLALSLIRLQHPKKASMSPIASMDFFVREKSRQYYS